MRKIEEVMEDNKRMKDDMDSMRNQISEDKQLIMNMKQLITTYLKFTNRSIENHTFCHL